MIPQSCCYNRLTEAADWKSQGDERGRRGGGAAERSIYLVLMNNICGCKHGNDVGWGDLTEDCFDKNTKMNKHGRSQMSEK